MVYRLPSVILHSYDCTDPSVIDQANKPNVWLESYKKFGRLWWNTFVSTKLFFCLFIVPIWTVFLRSSAPNAIFSSYLQLLCIIVLMEFWYSDNLKDVNNATIVVIIFVWTMCFTTIYCNQHRFCDNEIYPINLSSFCNVEFLLALIRALISNLSESMSYTFCVKYPMFCNRI